MLPFPMRIGTQIYASNHDVESESVSSARARMQKTVDWQTLARCAVFLFVFPFCSFIRSFVRSVCLSSHKTHLNIRRCAAQYCFDFSHILCIGRQLNAIVDFLFTFSFHFIFLLFIFLQFLFRLLLRSDRLKFVFCMYLCLCVCMYVGR